MLVKGRNLEEGLMKWWRCVAASRLVESGACRDGLWLTLK
jgi:hypothetical protein